MQLEDHLGDIIRKARLMSSVGLEAAAAAASISEAEMAELENSGKPPASVNFEALARKLGIEPRKLVGIAQGWLPRPRDLSAWRHLRMITTSDGEMSVNCYVIWDEAGNQAALFDTGFDAGPVVKLLADEHLELAHIFITHSHSDHIAAVPELRQRWAAAQIHASGKAAPEERRNHPGEVVSLGRLRIAHRDTPGHAEDGVTYVISAWPDDVPLVAIAGDTVFAGSMGRGNISWDLARQKVREQIFTLSGDTLICPGHGPVTTVAEEKEHNPLF